MIAFKNSEVENTSNAAKRVVRFELAPSTMINVVLILAGLWLLCKLLPVFLVLIAAFFIVETLNPLVNWLEKNKIGRGTAIAMVFVSLLIVTVVTAIFTVPALLAQASSILDQEPTLRADLADKLSGFPFSEALAKWLKNFKYGGSVTVANATAFSMEALGLITYALGAISLALYIMIDRDRMRGGLFALVPRTHHIRLSRVMMNLETIVGAYIRGQFITSASIGVFILILLMACGVENALALAVFGAVADILPYIGIFLPIGAAVLSAASHGPVITLVVLGCMFLYMEFESRVLVPKVYGHALRLPSTVVLISLLAGGTLMGITGALLALPFAAAVMMLIEELRVQLPGVQEQVADNVLRQKDDQGEKEYERRTEGVSSEESAAIAVEISGDRVKEENLASSELDKATK
ncbi:MAG TPA: AI-2E family transporter [bacterium]|nr:AI-2E family transporter [bacterium]